MHSLGIVHRDLKPDNIFIGEGVDGMDLVKIGDFGLATVGSSSYNKDALAQTAESEQTRSVGTGFYLAPEVKTGGGGSYTPKVDVSTVRACWIFIG